MSGSIGAFTAESVDVIMDLLAQDESEWAQKQLDNMLKKSPLALAVTHKSLREGSQMSFREAMTMELDVSMNFLKTQDFYEGIRAQLIDKDRNPQWSHEGVGKVTKTQLDRVFKKASKPSLAFLE